MNPQFSVLYMNLLSSFDNLRFPDEPRVTIVLYPTLKNDYAKFAAAYLEKREKNPEIKDPESYEVKQKLQNYCKLLLNAKQYEYQNNDFLGGVHHRIQAGEDDLLDLESIKYFELKADIDDFSETIPLFPCFQEEDSTIFFITYGFTEDYAFIFIQKNLDLPLVLFGLSEPTPTLNKAFDDKKSLEKLFVKSYHKEVSELKEKQKNAVCSLNVNQKFRLCSLVDDLISSERLEYPSEFGHRIEIDRILSAECDNEINITFHELEKDTDSKENYTISALPCFITYFKSVSVEFLLAEDPSNKYSVFLLHNIRYKGSTSEAVVVGYTGNIALLKHAEGYF